LELNKKDTIMAENKKEVNWETIGKIAVAVIGVLIGGGKLMK